MSSKGTIIVCGHGPGISDAVARRFGRAGHPVAIVARNAERLTAAVRALSADGIKAEAFPCDLGDVAGVRALVGSVRERLGPIGVVHWNVYTGGAGDLTTAPLDELRAVLDSAVFGLIATVQAALPDLKEQRGAILVTGGGLGTLDPKVDAMAVSWGTMGLAISKAAQRKTVGLLHHRLSREGIYVGEVVVMAIVKGTAFDRGNGTLDPAVVADRFWELHERRDQITVIQG
jgi:NAD(P)-dependent dehydrogenase (short-subunit alcohol dehydrogenase family)